MTTVGKAPRAVRAVRKRANTRGRNADDTRAAPSPRLAPLTQRTLPCRVPDLKLHYARIERDRLRKEGGSNGRLLELKELVPHEADDEAGFAHRRLAQKHQLKVAR